MPRRLPTYPSRKRAVRGVWREEHPGRSSSPDRPIRASSQGERHVNNTKNRPTNSSSELGTS